MCGNHVVAKFAKFAKLTVLSLLSLSPLSDFSLSLAREEFREVSGMCQGCVREFSGRQQGLCGSSVAAGVKVGYDESLWVTMTARSVRL